MQNSRNRLRIGVYVGKGASHSWTWFVDLLEKYAYTGLSFLDESDFSRRALHQDLLLVSGGDTFAVARALKPSGAGALHAFLEKGGLYIGSCAGAYLPLKSSKEPLCDFNFVQSKINNLTRDLPPAHRLPLKFSNRYGCVYVYHPVREDVRVRMADDFPVWGGKEVDVPLYGGPPLHPSEDARSRAFYTAFTKRTLFLTDREIAEQVYLEKVAACEKRIGRGRMLLLGPHFEHPLFPEGNDIIHQWITAYASHGKDAAPEYGCHEQEGSEGTVFSPGILKALKTEVSNMRIRAGALARNAVYWRIGAKVYEPEKILYLVEVVWKRLNKLKAAGQGDGTSCTGVTDVLEKSRYCHALIKELALKIDAREDSLETAQEVFTALKGLVVAFLDQYFLASASGTLFKAGTKH